jgi:hypothetical protein
MAVAKRLPSVREYLEQSAEKRLGRRLTRKERTYLSREAKAVSASLNKDRRAKAKGAPKEIKELAAMLRKVAQCMEREPFHLRWTAQQIEVPEPDPSFVRMACVALLREPAALWGGTSAREMAEKMMEWPGSAGGPVAAGG